MSYYRDKLSLGRSFLSLRSVGEREVGASRTRRNFILNQWEPYVFILSKTRITRRKIKINFFFTIVLTRKIEERSDQLNVFSAHSGWQAITFEPILQFSAINQNSPRNNSPIGYQLELILRQKSKIRGPWKSINSNWPPRFSCQVSLFFSWLAASIITSFLNCFSVSQLLLRRFITMGCPVSKLDAPSSDDNKVCIITVGVGAVGKSTVRCAYWCLYSFLRRSPIEM